MNLPRALIVILLGAVLGLAAKYTDGTAIGLIGTYLGFWVFSSTLVAVWSRTPLSAALHVFLFLASMLIAYYTYSAVLFGFFPLKYFLAWGAVALLSPIAGYVAWFARGQGWMAALCAALPISLLLIEGRHIFYTWSIHGAFAMFAAVLLWLLLPPTWGQRLRLILLAVGVYWVVDRLGLIYWFPW